MDGVCGVGGGFFFALGWWGMVTLGWGYEGEGKGENVVLARQQYWESVSGDSFVSRVFLGMKGFDGVVDMGEILGLGVETFTKASVMCDISFIGITMSYSGIYSSSG